MIARFSPPSNQPSQAGAARLIFLCLGKDIRETGMLAKLSVMLPVPILRSAAFQEYSFLSIPFLDFLENNVVTQAFKILRNMHDPCLRNPMFSTSS